MANISSAKLKKSLNAFKTEAKNKGYESHFLFLSTLKRLEVQINILDQMEQSMEEDGIITRTVYPEVPPRVEYALSALGESMRPILDSMQVWGEHYQARKKANHT